MNHLENTNRPFYLAFTVALSLLLSVGCSYEPPENYEQLTPIEQSIAKQSRWSKDRKKDSSRKPKEILALSGVKSGDRVVDLLGGGGYYSELFSHVVGDDGEVYLQNNSLFLRFSEKEMEKRLANNRLPNVKRLDSEYADMQLPNDIDLMFLGLCFHDFYVPRDDPIITPDAESMFEQIRKAMKPGGKILVIDHAAADNTGKTAAPTLHRIEREFVTEEFSRQGFQLESGSEILANSEDDHSLIIWNEDIMGNTDKMVFLFSYPGPKSE